MYSVDDYVMYGLTGVCKVVDIQEVKLRNSEKRNYYVLDPVYSKNTIIKTPVDNKKIGMRKIHSKEEVESLISNMPAQETFWIDNDKERNEKFKEMLKGGNVTELISLIKSVSANKKSKKLVGQKVYKADDELMVAAKKLLNEEFALILNINPEDVESYILSHVSEKLK